MGLLSKLVGGSIGEAADGVASAIDRFVETSEEKRAAEILLMKTKREPQKWQTEINKIEASHRSIFVAGWRPFIGWVCGVGLAYAFVLCPLMNGIFAAVLLKPIILPAIASKELIPLVYALLGLGGIRTWEKVKGVTK